MNLSDDARRLWEAADRMNRQALAGVAPDVRGDQRRLAPLLLFTDPTRLPDPWRVAERLPAGAGVVYRHFGDPQAETVARRLRDVTRACGLVFLIGLDADLADRVGADGVHLPERALSAAYGLSGKRPGWILTGAVHSVAAARAARDVHALVLSPVFTAGGASAGRPPLGVAAIRAAVQRAVCPVYALGGVGPDTVDDLVDTGACGIAGIGSFAKAFCGTVRI